MLAKTTLEPNVGAGARDVGEDDKLCYYLRKESARRRRTLAVPGGCILGLRRDLLPAPLLQVAQGCTGRQVAAHAMHTPTRRRR